MGKIGLRKCLVNRKIGSDTIMKISMVLIRNTWRTIYTIMKKSKMLKTIVFLSVFWESRQPRLQDNIFVIRIFLAEKWILSPDSLLMLKIFIGWKNSKEINNIWMILTWISKPIVLFLYPCPSSSVRNRPMCAMGRNYGSESY